MKIPYRISLFIAAFFASFALLFAPLIAHAADAAGVLADPTTIGGAWAGLITLITPLIVEGIKYIAPKLNTKWLPIIASIVGLVLALASQLLIGLNVNWWQGLLLGAAGVCLREIVNQFRQDNHSVSENSNTN